MKIVLKKSTLKKSGIILGAIIVLAIVALVLHSSLGSASSSGKNEVLIQTNYGNITVQLYPDKAPITVQNFESYVKSGFYAGTVFHRVMKGFVIQGGGFTADGTQKQTNAPIKLEVNNGLSNLKYTIAMARTSDPNSATSQFFINTADNTFLDPSSQSAGYAVFGKVISGFSVVDAIENVPTETKYGMQNWPVQNVVIEKVSILR